MAFSIKQNRKLSKDLSVPTDQTLYAAAEMRKRQQREYWGIWKDGRGNKKYMWLSFRAEAIKT